MYPTANSYLRDTCTFMYDRNVETYMTECGSIFLGQIIDYYMKVVNVVLFKIFCINLCGGEKFLRRLISRFHKLLLS